MKYLMKIFSILLIAGMVFSFVQPISTQAQGIKTSPASAPSDKIETSLLDKFSTEGKADFIVKYVEQADLSSAYEMTWDERGAFVYDTLTQTAEKSQAASKDTLDKLGLKFQTFIAGNELYVWSGNLVAAQALAALPEVDSVRATRTFSIDPVVETITPLLSTRWAGDLLSNHTSFDFAPNATTDWGILDTKADQFWSSYGIKGEGMVVANIDTGVQWNHPALVNQFKCGDDPTNPACWEDPSSVCAGGSMCDNNGHGTHTMGTMVGADDPALTYIAGMAPEAQWIACKGCESSSCSELALNTCADWILAPNGDPVNRPNVVNNSWGGGGGDTWYLPKVQAWRAAGIFPAFSAGNNYSCNAMGSPGDYQESFASAAHNSSRGIADFSSKGPSPFGDDPYTKPNISSPGVNICSSVPTNSWDCTFSGTSMASPHSAGAVALLWACNPSLVGQIDQTFQILQDSANTPPAGTCGAPPDGEGNYTFGYGYLDVLEAGLLNCGDVGYLDGHVTSNAQPIEGATVTAAPVLDSGNAIQAITDPDGYYHMTLTVGTYDVTAMHPLFTTQVVQGVEITVDVTTTQDIVMEPKGRLFGTVVDDPNGFPLAGATVTANDGTTTTTNNAGEYEMYLDSGSYSITAALENYAPQTLPVDIASGVDTQLDFALLAAISVVPDPIHATLTLGQTGSVDVVGTNNLAEDYPFEFLEIEMGKADGGSIVTSGGPDPFGYTFIDSNEPGGSLYEWVDATDGTALGLTDDGEANVALPFVFNFYGTDSSDIRVGNNGASLFGVITGDVPVTNEALGTTTTNNIIAPFWDDIDSDSGDVYYKVVGDAPFRQMIIEWYNRPHYSNVGNATFELILYETSNNIKFQYQDVVFGNPSYDYGASATVGIRQSGVNYLEYSFNQPVIQDNMSICFNYPGSAPCDGGDVLWFGESIPSGTIPGNGGTLDWTTYFTATQAAGIYQPGDYFGVLRLQPSTIGQPAKLVSVIMTVEATATQGLLDGNVSGDRPGGPLVADILIESSGGMTWTLTTDPDGNYSFYLEAGDYSVTASSPGYLPQTADVTIVATQTTTQDFLLLLDQPGIVVDPTSLEQNLVLGETAVQPLDISNIGQEPLEFELVERNGEFIPAVAGEDILVVQHDATAATAMENALTSLGYTYLGVSDAQFQAMTVDQLLEYLAVFHAGTTGLSGAPTASETLLTAYLDAGGSLFISDNDLGYYRNGSVFYDTYLQASYLVDNGGNIIDGLNLMAGLTVDITADPYPDGIAVGPEGTAIFQFQDGPDQNGVAVERNSYRAVYTGFDYNYIADPAQQVEVINRVLGFIAVSDAPWLSEAPITGTIPAGQTITIDVTFDAGAVAEPGLYTAVLKVRSNDPFTSVVDVPVTMNVAPSADLGLLEGTIYSLGYCDAESTPLEAAVLIEGSTGMTWTVTTDANGYYNQWLPADTYTVTASAPAHLDATGVAVVTNLQTTVLDLSLRSIQPCLDVNPTAFTVSLPVDTQVTENLAIINNGAGDLIWELHETTATLKTLDKDVMVNIPAIPLPKTPVASRSETTAFPARSFSMHIGQISIAPINVLIVTPDVVGGGDISLLLGTLAAFPDLVVTVWDGNAGTPTVADMQAYDVVFVGNDILWTSSSIDKTALSNNMADYIDAGGKLLVGSFIWSYDDWGFGGGRFITEDYSPFEIATTDFFVSTSLGSFDAASPLMAGITSITDGFNHQDPALSTTGVWVASWADGENFVAVSPNVVGLNQEYFHNAVFGGQVGELLHNAFLYLGGAQEWVDVPWVTEVPTSGVTLPDSTFNVDVTFDTTGLTVGQCYLASLGLVHNDAGQDNPFFIPLSLCVTEVQSNNIYLPIITKQ